MDFTLSREQLMAQQLFRDFAQNEVKPLAAEVDEEEKFPEENVKKMAKLGFFGIPVPKQYGGQGADVLTYAMCVEEMSKVCGTTGVIISAHTSLCIDPIMHFGTGAQKMKYVPDLAAGKKIGAFGLTEPGAGTDAQGQQTTAVLDGDHWVLNGSKIFITNAGYADVFIVIAVTGTLKDKKGRSMKEISAFIVERGFPGFSSGKHEKKMGIRGSSTCELVFEDCIVPKENLLGVQGRGFIIAMATLDGGRIGIAAQALGIAQGAYEEAVKYARTREQFGKPIGAQQNLGFKLADMLTKIEAARLLIYKAAEKKENHEDYGLDSAMAKMYASDIALEVVNNALQIHGGSGFIKGIPVEKMYRDAKITTIYEGTNEIQRLVIASKILGKLGKANR